MDEWPLLLALAWAVGIGVLVGVVARAILRTARASEQAAGHLREVVRLLLEDRRH
jgi:hypothetical protein